MGGSRREGAEAEFDLFFDECLPAVMSLARRLTGNTADAEDVAVEALGRACAHWPNAGSLESLLTFRTD
jgi:DNA-directed RNA polymerase specialized sigma24 family protein